MEPTCTQISDIDMTGNEEHIFSAYATHPYAVFTNPTCLAFPSCLISTGNCFRIINFQCGNPSVDEFFPFPAIHSLTLTLLIVLAERTLPNITYNRSRPEITDFLRQ